MVFFGEVGVSSEGVGLGECARAAVEGVAVLVERGKQCFVVLFFQRQSLVARAQYLVFEGFEFVGDVAFAVFQGLAAYPVQRGEVALAARDFDVVAVDVVVAHFQVVEAAFLFFGGF